jgi:hypothetical protein
MRTIDPRLLPKATQISNVLGQNSKTTAGLVYGYYGGTVVLNNGSAHTVLDGTLTLAHSSTNYIQMNLSTGAISFSTSAFTAGQKPLATVTTNLTGIISTTDYRSAAVYELNAGTGISVSNKVGSVTVSNIVVPAPQLVSEVVTSVAAAGYNLSATTICLVNLSAAPAGSLKLPSNPSKDTLIYIKDIAGNFATYPVTVIPAVGNLVESTTSLILNKSRMSVTLLYDGSGKWWII